MPKVLLTGSSGQLGKALNEALSDKFEVVKFSRENLDITNFKEVEKKIAAIKPNFVVNAAAFTQVDKAESEHELATQVNTEAIGNLAQLCKKFGVKLIHFSTDYVFGGKNETGFSEDAEPNPINFYGATKLAGEQKILKSDCEFAIIRTSWLFGDGENFVRTMLRLARDRAEIKVVSDQIGSPTFTKDLSETVKKILIENRSGIFHATNSGVTNWADFARKIFEIAKLPTQVIDISTAEFPTVAKRPQNSVLLNTKLPKMRRWEEGLREYLEK